MPYFNYHATAKTLIKKGKLLGYYFAEKYNAISPAKAFMLQAIGAERIEALCDIFEQDIKQELTNNGYTVKPRFSAGYGDIPLELQRDIVSVLDCQRKIGITLNESLVMSPSKSVTAIIGIKEKPEEIKK